MDPNTNQPMLGNQNPGNYPDPEAPAQDMMNGQPMQWQQTQQPQNNFPQPGMSLPQNPPPGQYQGVPQPVPVYTQQPQQNQRKAPRANPAMFQGVTYSVYCECPSCEQPTNTRVETTNSQMQWILCIVLFIFGFWLCCCIPFCVDSLKAGNHYCSNCGSSIGVIGK